MLLKLASLVPSLGKITSIYIQVGSISLSFDYLGMTHPAISCQSVGVSECRDYGMLTHKLCANT